MSPAPDLPLAPDQILDAPPPDPTARPSGPPRPALPALPARQGAVNELITAIAAEHRRVSTLHCRFLTLQAEAFQRLQRLPRPPTVEVPATEPDFGGPPIPVESPLPETSTGPASHPRRSSQWRLDRAQLEQLVTDPADHASDPRLQGVQLPAPPMLFIDRVTGIDGEPGSAGRIWTETEIRLDAWYLDATGRIPPGWMLEAAQGHQLLAAWLGIDGSHGAPDNRYREYELIFHRSPVDAEKTLCYEIAIGEQMIGECRVDGQPLLSLRAAHGTNVDHANLIQPLAPPAGHCPPDAPTGPATPRRFDADAVRAVTQGRPADCFGAGWDIARTHVRSPRIASGRTLLLGEVTEFDPDGGPWGRGYLRAQTPITASSWFLARHGTGQTMPRGLMLDGCLQAMAFYLTATGSTLSHDGWRFEPEPDRPYRLRWDTPVTPQHQWLTFDVFIHSRSEDPYPTVQAEVRCSVDEQLAFHAELLTLRLVPDWPLSYWRRLGPPAVQRTGDLVPLAALGGLRGFHDPKPTAQRGGIRYDFATMLTWAWGPMAEVFGDIGAIIDAEGQAPRLPGPPYLFLSRIAEVGDTPAGREVGSWVVAEYDLPEQPWFIEQNGSRTIPLTVVLEILLQPCGFVAGYVGSTLVPGADLRFRNLDGALTFHQPLSPATSTVRTKVTLRALDQWHDVTIETFDIEAFADNRPLATGTAVFGLFPPAALHDSIGLPVTEVNRTRLADKCDRSWDLTQRPARYFGHAPRLPGPMLLMIDRITGYWPAGGPESLGRLRAEKDVTADDWIFKSHFFTDPVQPGSLGIEAIYQVLQFYLIERGLTATVPYPRFEPYLTEQSLTWTYRGQVRPTHGRIVIEMDILEVGTHADCPYAVGQAWLWLDGLRIYHVPRLGARVVAGQPHEATPAVIGDILDPAVDCWVADHRPTWTVPTLPMMSIIDRLATASIDYTGQEVATLHNVQMRRWVPLPGPVRLRTRVETHAEELVVTLLSWRDSPHRTLSRFLPVASAQVRPGPPQRQNPARFALLTDARPTALPYQHSEIFHGHAFQYLTSLQRGTTGASGVLDAAGGTVPRGWLHQGLLDASTHVIPHTRMALWAPELDAGPVGYPHRITELTLFEPLPDSGQLEVEARFAGFDQGDRRLPTVDVQICEYDRVLVAYRLVMVLVDIGRFANVPPPLRAAFLRDRRYVPELRLSTTDGGTTVLQATDIETMDFLPGTVTDLYGLPPGTLVRDHTPHIAAKEHIAQLIAVHPSAVDVDDDLRTACCSARPGETHPITVTWDGQTARVVNR